MRWGISLLFVSCGGNVVLDPVSEEPLPEAVDRPPRASPRGSWPAREDPIPLDLVRAPPLDRLRKPNVQPPDELTDPSRPGPHPVGVRTIEMTDPSRDRTMLVDVWYPSSIDTGSTKTYTIETRIGATLASLEGTALEDAPIESGTFPLVLFSHGFGGIRFQSFFLTEHLASHGYVVVAPDHPGNRLSDFADLGNDGAAMQSSIDRPIDMLFVRDAILLDPSFSLDPTRIAMTGHSFGGWTAFEVGLRDPNLAVFVPFAPGFRNGSMPSMAAGLGRPLLIFGGSVDSTCSYDENQLPAYEAALLPKALLRIEGAGHLDFSNLCDIPLARLFVDDGCDPALIDPAVVQSIAKTMTTAFLGKHLKGESYELNAIAAGVSPVHYLSAD